MKVSDPSPEAFAHRDELGTVFSVSLQIALYAQEPLDVLAPHAMSCFDFFANHSAHGLKWQQRAAMWRAKRFDAKTANLFPALCRKPGLHLPLYCAFAGSGPNDFTPPIFATGGYGTFSWLQVHLPVANVARWQPLLSGLAERFPFRCGTVGLSLPWNELAEDRSRELPQRIGLLLKRYPGLNIGTPRELCDQALPPVNWVTVIGPTALATLGGFPRVRRAFASEKTIAVERIARGVSIRAGDRPRLGEAKNDLLAYRKVGSFVKALRGSQEIELDGLSSKESKGWLARFDA